MSNELKPFFELNGKTYEFEKTRYLITKYEELVKEATPPETENSDNAKNALIFQRLVDEVRENAKLLADAKEAFHKDPLDEVAKKTYKVYKQEYDEAFAEFAAFQTSNKSVSTALNTSLGIWEKLLIEAIAEQYQMDKVKAKETWEAYVDEIGQKQAVEWLVAFNQTLFEKEEKTDPFLARARETQALKAQQKSSLKRVINH